MRKRQINRKKSQKEELDKHMHKIPPYNTGKVLIGCNYQPDLRGHYNHDQDWIQKELLGVKPDWTYHVDNFIEYVLIFITAYAVLGLLSRGWYE